MATAYALDAFDKKIGIVSPFECGYVRAPLADYYYLVTQGNLDLVFTLTIHM